MIGLFTKIVTLLSIMKANNHGNMLKGSYKGIQGSTVGVRSVSTLIFSYDFFNFSKIFWFFSVSGFLKT